MTANNTNNILSSNFISKEDCDKILTNLIDFPVKVISFQISRFSEKYLGFLGDHFRLEIVYENLKNHSKTNHHQTKSFFIKTLPQFNESQQQYVEDMNVFEKELCLYKNLLSEFLKLATTAFCPEFYLMKTNCIVLEDLNKKGFDVSKSNYLSFQECDSLMNILGVFHAASIIYEEKKSNYSKQKYRINDHFKNEIQECAYSFVEGEPRQKWCVNATECLINCIKLSPNYENNEQIIIKLKKFIFEELSEFIKPSEKFRNVITHDDLWRNNFLFNKSQNQCVLIDFQFVRYTPPAMDIITALYLNLELELLNEHKEKFFNIYYTSFSNELIKSNLDVTELFPRNMFLECLKCYELAALVEAAMYGTHVCLPDTITEFIMSDIHNFNEFSFINRSKYTVNEFENNSEFRERFNHILVPLIELLKQY